MSVHSRHRESRPIALRARRLSSAEVLAGCLFLLPVMAVVADKGVVPLLLLALALAGPLAWRDGWRPARPILPALAALALLGWGLTASLWSFDPAEDATRALRVLILVACGWLVFDLTRHVQNRGQERKPGRQGVPATPVVAGFVAGLAVLAVELASGMALYRLVSPGQSPELSYLNRGATTLAVLIWPVLAVTARAYGRVCAVVLLAATAVTLAFTLSAAAKVALVAGVLVLLAAGLHRRLAAVSVALALAVSVLGMPWISQALYQGGVHQQAEVPASWQHRVHIWNFAAERAMERPWLGWGFNSARSMPNFGVTPFTEDEPAVISSHPHSAGLQIWMDLGVPGVILFLTAAGGVLAILLRQPATTGAAGLAVFAAALVMTSVSYGLWQTQWVATLLWAPTWAMVLLHPPRAASERSGTDGR